MFEKNEDPIIHTLDDEYKGSVKIARRVPVETYKLDNEVNIGYTTNDENSYGTED